MKFHAAWLLAISLALPLTGQAQDNSAQCAALLSPADIAAVVGDKGAGLVTKAATVVKETGGKCSRLFAIKEFNRFSDELILMVTPAGSPEGARFTLQTTAKDAKKYFGYTEPAIGDKAVHFRRKDPLSESRMSFNIVFAVKNYYVELRYESVDDGKQNKFVWESKELEPLAKLIADRLRAW